MRRGRVGRLAVPCVSTVPCLNTERPATPGRPLAARGRVLDWRPQLRLSSLHGGDRKHAEIGYGTEPFEALARLRILVRPHPPEALAERHLWLPSRQATRVDDLQDVLPNPRDTADGHRFPATLRRQFRTGTWVQASLHFHAYPAQFQPACSAPIRSSTWHWDTTPRPVTHSRPQVTVE